ncbi:hypothetical protein [Williamsia soli]|uniref:hypothetical protein n=1 Tax=Williamsia soli TaxID=364929 RepID=UPI001A9D302A|nr:hypothetical protein [Williamsia soli]
MLRQLKKRSKHLVAWIGDEPIGERDFATTFDYYDAVFAADSCWNQSGPVENIHMPWPHLLPSYLTTLISQTVSTSHSLVIVGTAYRERVESVRALIARGMDVRIIGSGWPPDLNSEKPVDRLALIERLRRTSEVVINLPHKQMRNTRNPFFFDLAAAGIPQIIVGGSEAVDIAPPHAVISRIEDLDMNIIETARDVSERLQQWATNSQTVDDRINLMIQRVSLSA